MIEVIVNRTGDRAEAETPDAALAAAMRLAREVGTGLGQSSLGSADTITFLNDGQHVKTLTWSELRT